MKIELLADQVDAMMEMYRDAVDMKTPMKDEFKIHFMNRRRDILTNYAQNGRGWLLLLQCMQPVGDDGEFKALVARVDAFTAWAEAELKKLDAL